MSSAPLTPEGAPLTEEEQKTVARLFSDPFYFPLQFKSWLQWFIENTSTSAPGGAGGASALSSPVPVGGVIFTAGTRLPGAYLWCNGAAISRVSYSLLYAEIGTSYGVGDGGTTFNVPDMQGRAVFGLGTNPDVNALGKSDGYTDISRRGVRHDHTVNPNPHSHTVPGINGAGGARGLMDGGYIFDSTAPSATNLSVGTPGNVPRDAVAWITMNGIIRYV